MTIEIDFDVFKELTNRRKTENVSYNDVLRELLNLNPLKKSVLSSDVTTFSGSMDNEGSYVPRRDGVSG